MPTKATMTKLTSKQVDGLKGRLLEIRKIGSKPIFIAIVRSDTIGTALKNADIPTDDDEIKLEAIRVNGKTWEEVTLRSRASDYSKIAVTTKVAGAK